ncbi:hypothetical protein CYG68_20780 [Morganella morganii]|uniref:Uncharacterized protein n=1 Tax=Morganella morganii TaxID=582 RepID=A0A8I0U843_MORMO|nr:hypothetical protein [Morganella morganii]MBE8614769.1 hypothetical protein [Morganella morganii]
MSSAINKHKTSYLMGITCDEYETAAKIYTLSVNANNLAEAIREMQVALEQAESMPHALPESELNGILIGQLKLTISANSKSRKPC